MYTRAQRQKREKIRATQDPIEYIPSVDISLCLSLYLVKEKNAVISLREEKSGII